MKTLARLYSFYVLTAEILRVLFLLGIRLYWGYLLMKGGVAKLENIESLVHFFESYQVPYPIETAWAVGFFETVGGAFFMLGLLTRLVAIPIIVIMVEAYCYVHIEAWMSFFIQPEKFYGSPNFAFLMVGLVLFFFGPGFVSLDAFFKQILLRRKRIPS